MFSSSSSSSHRSSVIKWNSLAQFLVLVFFLFFASQNDAVSDKSLLLRLKASFSDPAGVLSTWTSAAAAADSSHCSFSGVLCDLSSRVVAVNVTGAGGNNRTSHPCSNFSQFPLYGFGIRRTCSGSQGSLFGNFSSLSFIAELTELRVLSLPFNSLEGEIPEAIWGMENLEVLDLEGNLISGYLPLRVDGLKNLRVLNLGFNRIVGEIPSSIGSLERLEVLNLAGNELNGSLPGFVGRLRGVYLSFNQLRGVIPREIGENCGNLEHLDLSANSMVQAIPRSLGNCGRLRTLLLYSNLLKEGIPGELGRLKNLEVLDVSRNTLSGSVPRELGNCLELRVLVLSNLFDPRGDVDAGDLGKLRSVNDQLNYFEGAMPVEVLSLPKLRILWAPMVNLKGGLQGSWGGCESLEMVNLAQNFFSGEFPNQLGVCKKLHFVDLSSNNLTGELSEELRVPCMSVFDVSGNMLSGSVPDFSDNACPPVPSWNGNLFADGSASLLYASFFMSKVRALFTSMGGVGTSVVHNFGQNSFTGIHSLPVAHDRLGKKSGYTFLVGENNLTGPFPTFYLRNVMN